MIDKYLSKIWVKQNLEQYSYRNIVINFLIEKIKHLYIEIFEIWYHRKDVWELKGKNISMLRLLEEKKNQINIGHNVIHWDMFNDLFETILKIRIELKSEDWIVKKKLWILWNVNSI